MSALKMRNNDNDSTEEHGWRPALEPDRLARLAHEPLRIGVLLSGGGRSLANLLAWQAEHPDVPVRLVGAIHSRKRSAKTERAYAVCAEHDLPVATIRPSDLAGHAEFAAAQQEQLQAWRAEWVCMAGYLVHWPIPEPYRWRVLNIHPSLLPAYGGHGFYGARVHAAVLAQGERESGCTVHFADDEYDHGAILLQRRVPVMPSDTVETLAARVFAAECEAYPAALTHLVAGRISVNPATNRAKITE